MTEDDKKLVAAIAMSVSCNVGISPQTLQTATARIESLSADLERVTKERDALQQQLRQIRGTDQWRD